MQWIHEKTRIPRDKLRGNIIIDYEAKEYKYIRLKNAEQLINEGYTVYDAYRVPHIRDIEAFSRETDIPLFDNMQDNPEYFRVKKGMTFDIVHISPETYIEASAMSRESGKGVSVEEERSGVVEHLILEYSDLMFGGTQFPMPYIEYRASGHTAQEGRHRAVAAEKVNIESIPIMVIYPSYEDEYRNIEKNIHPEVKKQLSLDFVEGTSDAKEPEPIEEVISALQDLNVGAMAWTVPNEYWVGVARLTEQSHCAFGSASRGDLRDPLSAGSLSHVIEEVDLLVKDVNEYSRDIEAYEPESKGVDFEDMQRRADNIVNKSRRIEFLLDLYNTELIDRLGVDSYEVMRRTNDIRLTLASMILESPKEKHIAHLKPEIMELKEWLYKTFEIEPDQAKGDPAKMVIEGETIEGEYMGKGTFVSKAIRSNNKVYFQMKDDDLMKEALHFCEIESPYIPPVERIFDEAQNKIFYIMPYYRDITASDTDAWIIMNELKKANEKAKMQNMKINEPGWHLWMDWNKIGNDMIEIADVPEDIKEALNDLLNCAGNFGSPLFEFSKRNIGVDEQGNIIFRDVIHDGEKTWKKWQQIAREKRPDAIGEEEGDATAKWYVTDMDRTKVTIHDRFSEAVEEVTVRKGVGETERLTLPGTWGFTPEGYDAHALYIIREDQLEDMGFGDLLEQEADALTDDEYEELGRQIEAGREWVNLCAEYLNTKGLTCDEINSYLDELPPDVVDTKDFQDAMKIFEREYDERFKNYPWRDKELEELPGGAPDPMFWWAGPANEKYEGSGQELNAKFIDYLREHLPEWYYKKVFSDREPKVWDDPKWLAMGPVVWKQAKPGSIHEWIKVPTREFAEEYIKHIKFYNRDEIFEAFKDIGLRMAQYGVPLHDPRTIFVTNPRGGHEMLSIFAYANDIKKKQIPGRITKARFTDLTTGYTWMGEFSDDIDRIVIVDDILASYDQLKRTVRELNIVFGGKLENIYVAVLGQRNLVEAREEAQFNIEDLEHEGFDFENIYHNVETTGIKEFKRLYKANQIEPYPHSIPTCVFPHSIPDGSSDKISQELFKGERIHGTIREEREPDSIDIPDLDIHLDTLKPEDRLREFHPPVNAVAMGKMGQIDFTKNVRSVGEAVDRFDKVLHPTVMDQVLFIRFTYKPVGPRKLPPQDGAETSPDGYPGDHTKVWWSMNEKERIEHINELFPEAEEKFIESKYFTDKEKAREHWRETALPHWVSGRYSDIFDSLDREELFGGGAQDRFRESIEQKGLNTLAELTEEENEAFSIISDMILGRRAYGIRSEDVESKDRTYIYWSNGAEMWMMGGDQSPEVIDRHQQQLDANELVVPFKPELVDKFIPYLPFLPLYGLSFEAKERELVDPHEQQIQWALLQIERHQREQLT